MSYYGRAVGRAKGIGKIVYWDQGGGPMKAGLAPSIDVTTWARRVISRRTNNCCCDPIELTGIRVSVPWGWDLNDNPWNTLQAPSGDDLVSALVGPPRNDISNGVIQTQKQIYSIVTFNKPISSSLSSFTSTTFTPSVPEGTSIRICGLEEVTAPTSGSTVCVADTPISLAAFNRYYDLTERYTSVTQIPGGTSVPTTSATAAMSNLSSAPAPGAFDSGYLTSGSRVLVQTAISTKVAGVGQTLPLNIDSGNPKGGVTVDMWSGQTTNNPAFSLVQSFNGATPQGGVDPQYYGGFNVPVMDVSNGGFAIPSSTQKQNRYLGNGFGTFFPSSQRTNQPIFAMGIPLTSYRRNIALVQGDFTANINEYYSADALYVSNGPVSWLGYDHALFINITSLMQAMLKNAQSNTSPTLRLAPPIDGNPSPPLVLGDQIWDTFEATVPTAAGAPGNVSTPWQSWGVRQMPTVVPDNVTVPAWADLLMSAYGDYLRTNISLDSLYDGVTPGPNYAVGQWGVGFPNQQIGTTLGDVVEKLRQFTYNAFPSYTIRNILRSKYDCGNDGFDGPIEDINLPSGSVLNKAISSATLAEGGLLSL